MPQHTLQSTSPLPKCHKTEQQYIWDLQIKFVDLKEVTPKPYICTKVSHFPKFLLLKCRFSLWNSSSKKAKIWTSSPPFWIVLSCQAEFSWSYSIREILSTWLPQAFYGGSIGFLSNNTVKLWATRAPLLSIEQKIERQWCATIAMKWCHTPFYVRPNNLPPGITLEIWASGSRIWHNCLNDGKILKNL